MRKTSQYLPRETATKTKKLKVLPSRKRKTTKCMKKKYLPTAAQASIDKYVKEMDSNTKQKVFNVCSKTSIQQPTNPTNAAIGNSPTLSIIMEADRRFGNDVELCHNAFLSWYMTAGLEVQQVDTLDAFMLASTLVTTSFHDNISIDDILKTIQNVPTSSMSADSPCKILKTTTKMTIGNTTFDRKDLCTRYPDKWLNDQVIHAYLGLLKAEYNAVYQMGCYVLPCFLATMWEAGTYNTLLYPKVPLELYQIIFLPVCYKHQWFLLVAFMETASVSALDSLPDAGRTQKFSEHWRHFMAARGDRRIWQTGDNTSSKQMDRNACGVFVLMKAEAIIKKTATTVMRHCHVRRYALKKAPTESIQSNDAQCDLPFCVNTDQHLRKNQCDKCDKWAHPKCLGLNPEKAMSLCVFC